MSFRCAGLRCPAWQAPDGVCAGAVFVGPVVQSARFGEPETCQNWSKSFWRHSPVLVLNACRIFVKVGFRGRSSSLVDFEFLASLLCVTGAALLSVLVQFRGRRDTLELVVQISWRAQYFDSARSLSLWRGAHFENAKRNLCARWVGRIALAVVRCAFSVRLRVDFVARCTFCEREANPLRTSGGSNRSRCGAVHILRREANPPALWVKSLSLWRGAHSEHAKRTFCALWVGQIALAVARCAF